MQKNEQTKQNLKGGFKQLEGRKKKITLISQQKKKKKKRI